VRARNRAEIDEEKALRKEKKISETYDVFQPLPMLESA
jgi:hypothetical protein